jgi:hypothetical protein
MTLTIKKERDVPLVTKRTKAFELTVVFSIPEPPDAKFTPCSIWVGFVIEK